MITLVQGLPPVALLGLSLPLPHAAKPSRGSVRNTEFATVGIGSRSRSRGGVRMCAGGGAKGRGQG